MLGHSLSLPLRVGYYWKVRPLFCNLSHMNALDGVPSSHRISRSPARGERGRSLGSSWISLASSIKLHLRCLQTSESQTPQSVFAVSGEQSFFSWWGETSPLSYGYEESLEVSLRYLTSNRWILLLLHGNPVCNGRTTSGSILYVV